MVKGSWERIPVSICRSTVNDKSFFCFFIYHEILRARIFLVGAWKHAQAGERGEVLESQTCL